MVPSLCRAALREVVPGRHGLPLQPPGRAQPPAGGHDGDNEYPGWAEPGHQHLQEDVSDARHRGHGQGQGCCRQVRTRLVPWDGDSESRSQH